MANSMNMIDIIFIVIFAFSMFVGFARGFVGEIISLAALIAAVFIAVYFTEPFSRYIMDTATVQNFVNQATESVGVDTSKPISYFAYGIAFGILFFCTLIVGTVVNSIMNIFLQTGVLGLGNRFLGALFGLARGYVFSIVIILIVQLSPLELETLWQQSKFVNAFQPQVLWLASYISPSLNNLKQRLGGTIQDMGAKLQGFTSQ